MPTRSLAQGVKHSRTYREKHREAVTKRARAWRAANVERARQQWRDYYYRRLKLIRCGIDPGAVPS